MICVHVSLVPPLPSRLFAPIDLTLILSSLCNPSSWSVKYSHEIQAQQEAIEQVKREEQMVLPDNLDYFRYGLKLYCVISAFVHYLTHHRAIGNHQTYFTTPNSLRSVTGPSLCFHCLLLSPTVYCCLSMFIIVTHCLLLSPFVYCCLPLFTVVSHCLLLSPIVYYCLPLFIAVSHC